MIEIQKKEKALELINGYEDRLREYELGLLRNPDSTFYKGLVENTKEVIEELKISFGLS